MSEIEVVQQNVFLRVQKSYPQCSNFASTALDGTHVFTLVLHDNLMGQAYVARNAEGALASTTAAWARQILANCALHNAKHTSRIRGLEKIDGIALPMVLLEVTSNCERNAHSADEAAQPEIGDSTAWRTLFAAARAVQEAHSIGWLLGPFRPHDLVAFCRTGAMVNLHRASPCDVAVSKSVNVQDLIRAPPDGDRDEFADLWALGCFLVERSFGPNVLPLNELVFLKLQSVFKTPRVRFNEEEFADPEVRTPEALTPVAVETHHRMLLAAEGVSPLRFWGFGNEPFSSCKSFKVLDMCIDLCFRARSYAQNALGLPLRPSSQETHQAASRILALVVAVLGEQADEAGKEPGREPGTENERASPVWAPLTNLSSAHARAWAPNAVELVKNLTARAPSREVAHATSDVAWPFAKQASTRSAEFEIEVRKAVCAPGFAEGVVEALVAQGVLSAPVPSAPRDLTNDLALRTLRAVMQMNFNV